MNSKYRLVIPSRGRAKWLDTHATNTLRQIPPNVNPTILLREDEKEEMLFDYHKMINKINPSYSALMISKENCKKIYGAAQTYDYIIDSAIEQKAERLIILDDDLRFSMHNPIYGAKPDFKLCNYYELQTLLEHFADITSYELPLATLTPIMTRSQPLAITPCKPIMMAYSFYLPFFKEHPEYRFWIGKEIEARCDLNLTLRLLTDGYLTAFFTRLFIPDNVNNPGGCSVYRDLDHEKASIAYLKKYYGHLGILRSRIKKGWINDPDVEREALTIQWRKAFNKKKFQEHFGIDPNTFVSNINKTYDIKYAEFIRTIREESTCIKLTLNQQQ